MKFVEVTAVNAVSVFVNTANIAYFREIYINGKYYTEITMIGADKLLVLERYSELEEMLDGRK